MSNAKPRTHAMPRRAIEGQSETEDQLIGMVTALAAQLAVTRERLDTVERLAEAAALFGPDQVDRFVPDAAATQQRDTIRQTLIARIFRPIRDAAARTAQGLEGARK
jgi:hypothetical protein